MHPIHPKTFSDSFKKNVGEDCGDDHRESAQWGLKHNKYNLRCKVTFRLRPASNETYHDDGLYESVSWR